MCQRTKLYYMKIGTYKFMQMNCRGIQKALRDGFYLHTRNSLNNLQHMWFIGACHIAQSHNARKPAGLMTLFNTGVMTSAL